MLMEEVNLNKRSPCSSLLFRERTATDDTRFLPPLSSVHPGWLRAAAPGYEKQTAGLAQASRSPSLKPKCFRKTNKRLPQLTAQGFLWSTEAVLLLMHEIPSAPNFKVQIKDKVMCRISMGVFKPCFSQAEKGDCFIMLPENRRCFFFFIFICEGTAWINHSVLTQKHHCARRQTPFGISWLSQELFHF